MNLIPETLAALAVSTVVPLTTLDGAGIVGISIEPTDGAVRWGDSTVTTSTGEVLNQGERMVIETRHPNKWYVVAVTGTVNLRRNLLKGSR